MLRSSEPEPKAPEPSELPPDSELSFDVELMEIVKDKDKELPAMP